MKKEQILIRDNMNRDDMNAGYLLIFDDQRIPSFEFQEASSTQVSVSNCYLQIYRRILRRPLRTNGRIVNE